MSANRSEGVESSEPALKKLKLAEDREIETRDNDNHASSEGQSAVNGEAPHRPSDDSSVEISKPSTTDLTGTSVNASSGENVEASSAMKDYEVKQTARAAVETSTKPKDELLSANQVTATSKLAGLPIHSQNLTLTVPQATQLPPETGKPVHGSEEWHKLRKMNHKEVERRRRESINHAILELQDLLPTHSSNKSQIIKRAAEYIRRLKENENANIEKWTLEKLITDQAVNELANSNEKLKTELEKAYREIEHWKKVFFENQKEINRSKQVSNEPVRDDAESA
ncbi:DEKNAAC102729 [Brettanomyces naardenensis]|uniref:DEKNAAC102729 n=1 Tax=Brettanomyces naardenensis TaxID=13370 RepID=A0A448YKD5_BRENA|nr:DEKNAAC102729 [Brettanomyces naardenensis]